MTIMQIQLPLYKYTHTIMHNYYLIKKAFIILFNILNVIGHAFFHVLSDVSINIIESSKK